MSKFKQGEALTIAYIAKGMADYLGNVDWDKQLDAASVHHGGEMGVIDTGISYAAPLDALADEVEDASGVFLYEVAEEFGAWIAEHIHKNAGLVYDSAVWAEMRRLIADWKGI